MGRKLRWSTRPRAIWVERARRRLHQLAASSFLELLLAMFPMSPVAALLSSSAGLLQSTEVEVL